MSDRLRVASVVPSTTAEGPFRRLAIWVSGCSIRCPGCCNPELFDPSSGTSVSIDSLGEQLEHAKTHLRIEGITVLGGEPTEQLPGTLALAALAQTLGLGVLVFTGQTVVTLRQNPRFGELTSVIDTLVDGRYEAKRPEPLGGRRYLGSTNQQLHHFSDRYADPQLWRGPARVEAHIDAHGHLTLHGFPRPVARLRRALAAAEPGAVLHTHGQEQQAKTRLLADEERARRVLDR